MGHFGPFWAHLDQLLDNKQIVLSGGVTDELAEKLNHPDDDKNEWRKWWLSREPSVKDEDHQETYSDIVNSCQVDARYRGNCNQTRVDRFLDKADPFLVAIAKDCEITIVSDEKPGSLKIPTICALEDVRCLNLIDFLREMKFSFTSSLG